LGRRAANWSSRRAGGAEMRVCGLVPTVAACVGG
jgi:hypothetical protein